MIKLGDFVAETLTEISRGIKKAQDTCGKDGANINPVIDHWPKEGDGLDRDDGTAFIDSVEFDVLLTAETETATKGGIGVFVGAIGLGSQGESAKESAQHHRIKFAVRVSWPTGR